MISNAYESRLQAIEAKTARQRPLYTTDQLVKTQAFRTYLDVMFAVRARGHGYKLPLCDDDNIKVIAENMTMEDVRGAYREKMLREAHIEMGIEIE